MRYLPGILKHLLLYMGVFSVVLSSLYLLMVLFATIPNKAIRENMKRSAVSQTEQAHLGSTENGQLKQLADNNADRIWLNIAWQMGKGDPFVSVLDTKYYDGDSFGLALGLRLTVEFGKEANTDYTRYWHGGAALLRFLHIWTDLQGSRIIGFLCILYLIFLTVRYLFLDGHGDLGMCLLASVMAVSVFTVRLSFEYIPCFLVCFGFCPLFLKLEKRGDLPLTLLALAAGTATAFFDFLTAETVTILVPLILVMAVRSMDRRLISKKDTAVLLLQCLILWGLAYGGTFLVKWIVVEQVTGENHLATALSSAGVRMIGAVSVNGQEIKPGALLGIIANLSVLFGSTELISYSKIMMGLFLCTIAVYVLIRVYWCRRPVSRGTGFILGLGTFVLVRFGILANHSYLHAFFTYRALLSSILAVLTAMMLNLRPQKKRSRRIDGIDDSDKLLQ